MPWRPTDDSVLLVAFDPGSTTLGVARLYLKPDDLSVVQIHTQTVNFSSLLNNDAVDNERIIVRHGEKFARIRLIRSSIERFLKLHEPEGAVLENPFFHNLQPTAFEPLIECKMALSDALFAYDPDLKMMVVSPSEGKLAVGAAAGEKDKAVMLRTTLNHPTVSSCLATDHADVDQHGADAIAAGLACIAYLKKHSRSV